VTRASRPHASTRASFVDYDLHGLVGIRLVDPSPDDLAAVTADVGKIQGTLDRDPEITIRFVHELLTADVLRYVEPHEIGFTDDAFLVLDGRSGGRAQIPVDQIGKPCEILCQSGFGAISLLRPIVNLVMLTKDVVALHASAFTYNGKGALVAGWARGGKTSSLLAFMCQGADFIADDHVYVGSDRNRLYGSAAPVSLRAWHLDELPAYRQYVNWRELSHLRASTVLRRVAYSAANKGRITTVRKVASRIGRVAEDAHVSVSPERLFGRSSLSGKLDKAFLAIAHDSREVIVEQVDSGWLADRLVFLIQSERRRLLTQYVAFRFAFPDKPNDLIERASNIERDILRRVLAESDSYVVYHPFPAPVEPLFAAMAPALS
jgi:hypothetical protein